MRIFRSIANLSKPTGREKISSATLAYIQTRTRMEIFTLVQNEFDKSGLSQADLAARLGKGTDRICKLMGSPGNWTLDTIAELLFAINGGVVRWSVAYPLENVKREEKSPGTDKRATFVPVAQYELAA